MDYTKPTITTFTDEELAELYNIPTGVCLYGNGASFSTTTGCSTPYNYSSNGGCESTVAIPITFNKSES